jgi:hypothetical protein
LHYTRSDFLIQRKMTTSLQQLQFTAKTLA